MRIYNSLADCHNEIKRELGEMGITYVSQSVQDEQVELKTKELIGYGYRLNSLGKDPLSYIRDNMTTEQFNWMLAEVYDRQHCTRTHDVNPGKAWKQNADFWKTMMHDGKFAYTYAERFQPQLTDVIKILRKRRTTRHGILTMWNPIFDLPNVGGKQRVPCSLTYQFLIRDDEMHVIYNMRSCDFIKFFLLDVFMTWGMAEYIAECVDVKVKVASLTHNIGSLHCFERDVAHVF